MIACKYVFSLIYLVVAAENLFADSSDIVVPF